jgi:Protein of unknown function (DUF1286)
MKALTHYLFSTGVSFGLLSLSHALMLGSIAMALWLSLSINYLIDVLGHVSRRGNPTRTWLTHSVLTAPVLGALIAAISLDAASRALGSGPLSEPLALWAIMGALVSEGHLFLDSLTEAGVYALKRRIAIAHFNYDNMTLNVGFALLGVLLITVSLG